MQTSVEAAEGLALMTMVTSTRSWSRQVNTWLLFTEGSTRPAAVLRIGAVFFVFAEYATEFAFYNDARPGRFLLAISLYASMTMTLIGWKSRFAAAWLGATLAGIWFYAGRELRSFNYQHHHTWLLMCMTLLLALAPCGGSYSLDRWLALKNARTLGHAPPQERGNLWAVRLMALQMSAVYFWGAYDKLTPEFLSGARLEQLAMHYYTGSTWLAEPVAWILQVVAVLVVAGEFLLAFGLFVTRWQRWLIPGAIGLHWLMFVLLPVWIFSAQMTLYLIAFVPADAVHRFLDEFNSGKRADLLT